jgi:acetolactate synthase-1/2/3 large subunit
LTRPETREARVVDVFLDYLRAEGVKLVFGIPGGLLFPFFEAVEKAADIRLVVAKHEEGAAFMADGFSRTTGTLSVCAGTGGPGSTNLLTGVACAYADGVPMLVVTGQAASHALGKGAAQETTREDIDIVAMFAPITKYSAMVTSPESFAHHLRRALRQAMTGRPGPAHLNVPVDIWEKPLVERWLNPSTYRPATRTFDRATVARASDALLEAEYPVLLAGSGVVIAQAREHLHTLAELLPARVATTPRAKGVFAEDHELSLGVFGFAGHEAARTTLLGGDVDVLATLGASLNETTTFNWSAELVPKKHLIQLDIDSDRIGRNYPVDIPLVGDAQTILVELVYHLHRMIRDGRAPRSKWPRETAIPRGEDRYEDREHRESVAMPMTPQRWRRDLMEVLPGDAIVFSDIGGHMLFNVHHLEMGPRHTFVLNLGFGSMGHGTVAPIGCALADHGRPVVAIIGDACFTMNGMELLTAAEYDVPVIWIVENNNMHGISWHGSAALGRRLDSVRYRRPLDIAPIARAMGVTSVVVDQPGKLQSVFCEALSRGSPTLIEIRCDGSIPPPLGSRNKSLAGFIRR